MCFIRVVLNSDNDKLSPQTYDGAAVMSGEKRGELTIIKQCHQYAHLVHCYVYQLNLIIKKAASQKSETGIFFSRLAVITCIFC